MVLRPSNTSERTQARRAPSGGSESVRRPVGPRGPYDVARTPRSDWDEFPYRRKGPWPQPAPRFPDYMAPAVLHIPKDELLDWHRHIGVRYVSEYLTYWPTALDRAFSHDGYREVSDVQFGALFQQTVFARGLCAELDPPDLAAFGRILASVDRRPDAIYKADYTIMRGMLPFEGLHTAPTTSLLLRYGDRLVPIAIRVGETTFTPSDADAWELAKYFALQGAAYHILLAEHPLAHFPTDTINAVTKTALPRRHVLSRLLMPHTRFALRQNAAVLYSPRSVVNNAQWLAYCALTGPTEGIRTLNPSGYAGIPGSSAYKPYRYPMRPRTIHGDLGPFLDAYHATIYRFVERVLDRVPRDDAHVVRWADAIASFLPGFPDGEAIAHGDALIAAVASYIWQVSVVHAADHESFGRLPIDRVPLRLRVAPPTANAREPLDRTKLATRSDLFRAYMCRQMFFQPHNVQCLHEVDYGFADDRLELVQRWFRRELERTEQRLTVRPTIAWDRISASIQY